MRIILIWMKITESVGDEIQSTPIDNDAKAVNIGSGVRVDGRIEGAETSDHFWNSYWNS